MNKKRFMTLAVASLAAVLCIRGADPTSTSFTSSQCEGTHIPYPDDVQIVATPDSLTPVLINYVGRHGARFPSSPKSTRMLRGALERADSLKTITPQGRKLLALTRYVEARCKGAWGALDSLGIEEIRGIASRTARTFPGLLKNGNITAYSSYAPRCIMSMANFTYQLSRLDNTIEVTSGSGRRFSYLLRPFDVDQEYIDFRNDAPWGPTLDAFEQITLPLTPLIKVLGKEYQPASAEEARALVMAEYGFLSGLSAMSVPVNVMEYLSKEEYNAMWAVGNLRQYLRLSASTISSVPAEIAAPLLLDIVNTTQEAVNRFLDKKQAPGPVGIFRFGHAETLIPLFSLMRMPGAYYLTNYFDTVALHWQNFNLTPMAANLRLVLFRTKSGRFYVRIDHNEKPVRLDGEDSPVYLPWDTARERLTRFIPLHRRI